MRLAKFLSLAGICSRRHAGRLIDEGLVSVNGEVAGHLTFVEGDELIIADGHKASIQPFGYVLYTNPLALTA
jgi:16S rRNA pseudouridine516 synthase